MKKVAAILLILCIASFTSPVSLRAAAQDQNYGYAEGGGYFSADELDNLLAPIALYPDPLLAQVLLAATFPDQVDEADREMRAGYDHYDIDYAPWDVSVKAVAHYPAVLHMMADKLDWTTSLGQAYVSQSTDVMTAVQRLRMEARDAGNLVSTPQQEVIDRDGYVYVYPARPQYIYVPVYDPGVVYVRRTGFFTGVAVSFGAGLVIGAWLNHDCDWREHRVYYHGWDRDDGWEARSRPYVHVTNVYVNNNYRTVVINRTVVDRHVDYEQLNRYNTVHQDVDYSRVRGNENRDNHGNQWNRDDHRRWNNNGDNRDNHGNQNDHGPWVNDNRGNRGQGDNRDNRGNQDNHGQWNRGDRGQGGNPGNDQGFRGGDNRDINNRIIQRNINTNDPRIDANRGHFPGQPEMRQPNVNQGSTNPQGWQQHDNGQVQQQDNRRNTIFQTTHGLVDPRTASQRGQESRQQVARPPTPGPPMQPRGNQNNGNASRGHDNGNGRQQGHDNGGQGDRGQHDHNENH